MVNKYKFKEWIKETRYQKTRIDVFKNVSKIIKRPKNMERENFFPNTSF